MEEQVSLIPGRDNRAQRDKISGWAFLSGIGGGFFGVYGAVASRVSSVPAKTVIGLSAAAGFCAFVGLCVLINACRKAKKCPATILAVMGDFLTGAVVGAFFGAITCCSGGPSY